MKKQKYDIDFLLDRFQIKRNNHCDLLSAWLEKSTANDDFELPQLLEEQRQKLDFEGNLWNEEELKMHFLSFVFRFADAEVVDKVKMFYERPLSGKVDGMLLSVVCDALLASPLGLNTPRKPYFFLQEFKKGKKASEDAEGQMLVAMLIAQNINADHAPIYGCYLIGKDWYFTTLHEKNYCFSKSYDASDRYELMQILQILRNLKFILAENGQIEL